MTRAVLALLLATLLPGCEHAGEIAGAAAEGFATGLSKGASSRSYTPPRYVPRGYRVVYVYRPSYRRR